MQATGNKYKGLTTYKDATPSERFDVRMELAKMVTRSATTLSLDASRKIINTVLKDTTKYGR